MLIRRQAPAHIQFSVDAGACAVGFSFRAYIIIIIMIM